MLGLRHEVEHLLRLVEDLLVALVIHREVAAGVHLVLDAGEVAVDERLEPDFSVLDEGHALGEGRGDGARDAPHDDVTAFLR